MTNATRKQALIQAQVRETEAKLKGVNLITFILMATTLGLLLFGLVNYAVVTLLLTTLGLTTSNSLGMKVQLLESDTLQAQLEKYLDDE